MRRKPILNQHLFLFFTCVLCMGCYSIVNKKKGPVPNIIIYLTDDLGYGDLGCYGNPINMTPAIDKFATQGVLLTDCHSAGTVCSPSRAGLLTGRNPYRSGFYYLQGASGTYLKSDEITIAEVLKSSGYETAFIGKWHLSRLEKTKRPDEPNPGDQGFDYWFATTHNAFDGPKDYKRFIRNGKETGAVSGWYCDVLTEEATKWLTGIRDKSKPFLLVISTHEPHTPLEPPVEYSRRFDNAKVDSLAHLISYGGVARPNYNIDKNKKEYYGTVSQLDNAFGNLMKTIDKENLEENTMVIFTSDNGPESPVNLEESQGQWEDPIRDFCFGTPGIYRGMKRFPYEGGHRVPGIVRYPAKILAGTTSNELVVATDFLPTAAQLAHVKTPADRNMDGINAFPAFLGKKPEREKPYLWLFPMHGDSYRIMPQISMRYEDYTLLGWFPEKSKEGTLMDWMKSSVPVTFSLYNLSRDPGQKNDLALNEPEILNKLKPMMIEQWKEIRDEGPNWEKINNVQTK